MTTPNTLVLYIRISMEDLDNHTDGKEESNSIAHQRELLQNYVREKTDLAKYKIIELCDDGYSGTNLNRPGMTKLLEMARRGQVGCIVVKDFSRFGGDYLTVSDYIDQIFPFLGIRFISVNDYYDSAACKGVTSGVDMAFRNVIYGYYSHDLSLKVKSGKRIKAEKGDFLSPFAPIGYQKSQENKNKLEVEPEGAAIVRKIFQMAGDGMNVQQITRKLNREVVPTPSQVKNKMGKFHKWWVGIGDGKVWNEGIVLDILRDERYLGKNVYGKKARKGVGDSHIKRNDREEWVVVKGCHEPVVTEEMFAAAQRNICEYTRRGSSTFTLHLFSGKLRCMVCGYSLRCIKRPVLHYRCMTWRNVDGCRCTKEILKESELAQVVFSAIRLYVKTLLDEQVVRQKAEENGHIPALKKQLALLKENIRDFQERKALLYERLAEGEVNRAEFCKVQEMISNRQKDTQQEYDEVQKELRQLECIADHGRMQKEELEGYLGVKELTREMVEEFVECIYVYSDGLIHIQWKFEEGKREG